MEKGATAWILCPSKKFPGLYYYFNTQTGERVWSWTVSKGQIPDGNTVEKPQAGASFGQVEFPKYLQNNVVNSRKTCALQRNLNKPNVIASGLNFMQQSREAKQLFSTTTNAKFKLAPARFKPIPNNPFSLRLPEYSCEGSSSKTNVFEPVFYTKKLPKRQSSTDIEDLSQALKRARISTSSCTSEQDNPEWMSDEIKAHVEFVDDSSSSMMQYRLRRNDNVKVSINFLRNLSTSENTDTWYLVPDLAVLLDDLSFIKKFIAGDETCSLMTPAAVLAKLLSLSDDSRDADSRATVAAQVLRWLTKNSVFQNNYTIDDRCLDEATIHQQIIEHCKQEKVFHLVIITKSKNLWDQARRNDIHAYYLNSLKIINQEENLFLLNPDSTTTFKWPVSSTVLDDESKSEINTFKNFEIHVTKNGKRSFICKNSNKRENPRNVFENHLNNNKTDVRRPHILDLTQNSEDSSVEDKLRDFCAKHADIHANVHERVDEWSCCYLQVMEYCLNSILQSIPETQSGLPCWLHQGLQLLKEHFQDKQLCAIVDNLVSMFEYIMSDGVMRPKIKSDTFLKILGAGMLLIEQLENITSEIPALSESKEMLNGLIANIKAATDFPKVMSISFQCRQRLGDGPFRMKSCSANGDCFVSSSESTSQQDQCEVFDVQDCGSIELFQDNMADGNTSNPTYDKSIQPINSDQNKSEEMQSNSQHTLNINTVNHETGSSGIHSGTLSGDPVLTKLSKTVDKLRNALSIMNAFIERQMEELFKGEISKGRKEILRKKTNMFKDTAAKMCQTLKIIQQRENHKDPNFGKKFAVQNPAYTECIENGLKQVENMQKSFRYLLQALK